MKNMRIPTRPAPTIAEALNKNSTNKKQNHENIKKKPPPRPPPPNLNKVQSKSAWNLNQQFDGISLIDLSPPESLNTFVVNRNRAFGGSVSSSFSSSTSSLASSKKVSNMMRLINSSSSTQLCVPTIIRPQSNKQTVNKAPNKSCQREQSPPMPLAPPPSPPKETAEVIVPYGIALYQFPATHADDLALQVNDIVFLLRQVNSEWFYGRVEDRKGMFPASFVSIQVPLPGDDNVVVALYEFNPQVEGDLKLRPGQMVHVTGRLSDEWLLGESEGHVGQFPSNFVDRVPSVL
ncbi:hypothetical protein RI129_011988 [Pyrocoelia pectoralis]|uniref:SH3 domain-containing protein n=1 Tax=Pyrocoelia pectoralis TaxID=417401 RepID=A0AAN7V6T1_9COLE